MNQINIKDVCQLLEIPLNYWNFHSGMNFHQATEHLKKFKELAKTQRKLLAKRFHPDKTGGDDAKIKEINNVVDLVMKLEIKVPVQRVMNVVYSTTSSWPSYDGSSSYTYRR